MQNLRRNCIFFVMDSRILLTLCIFLMIYIIRQLDLRTKPTDDLDNVDSSVRYDFQITRTWDDKPVDHVPVNISLLSHSDDGVKVLIRAPFFNDPEAPNGVPGEPFPNLWDYEVVEVFFLNVENHYLEVELCPHGQHLLLLLKGYRKPVKDMLPLEYKAIRLGDLWQGQAIIPAVYFPKKVIKMNAYAIHGSGDKRTYEALYPTPEGKYKEPDFHRLEYFKYIDFASLLPSNAGEKYKSSLWQLS